MSAKQKDLKNPMSKVSGTSIFFLALIIALVLVGFLYYWLSTQPPHYQSNLVVNVIPNRTSVKWSQTFNITVDVTAVGNGLLIGNVTIATRAGVNVAVPPIFQTGTERSVCGTLAGNYTCSSFGGTSYWDVGSPLLYYFAGLRLTVAQNERLGLTFPITITDSSLTSPQTISFFVNGVETDATIYLS